MGLGYEEVVRILEETPRFTGSASGSGSPSQAKKLSPEEGRRYYEALGCPGASRPIVHVAGTNGKGSTCRYLAEIAGLAGIKTALFTSPHLVDTCERMRVGGEMIPQADFVRLYEKALEPCLRDPERYPRPLYFDHLFFMAMLWFEERDAELIILETGLGGRLDATNLVQDKTLTVITRIGYDHMQYLGDTLEAIAGEKAGILRKGVPAVVWSEPPEALGVFQKTAEDLGTPLYVVSPEEASAKACADPEKAGRFVDFSLSYRYDNDRILRVNTPLRSPALYQAENAGLAAVAAGLLEARFSAITPEIIARGLYGSFWPGRMEEVRPGVYLDGAHNEDGIRAFIESASTLEGPRVLLFSAVNDKRYTSMLRSLHDSGLFDRILAAPLHSRRAVDETHMLAALKEAGLTESCLRADPMEALTELMEGRRAKERIFVTGSLYLIGEIRERLCDR